MAEMIEFGVDKAALEKALQALILKETGVSVDYRVFASDDDGVRSVPQCLGWIPEDQGGKITNDQAKALDGLMGDLSLFDDVESSLRFLVRRQLGITWLPDRWHHDLWIEINPDTNWVTIYVERERLEIAMLEQWAASRFA